MRVSIIISTYNYGQFLPQAVESALDQTYSDVEVIVVNDGSTDNTSEIIQPYLKKITYIEQPNSGVVMARNAGAEQSTGMYLLFLDADDYLSDDFVESNLAVFRRNPRTAFVYADRQIVGSRDFRFKSTNWNPNLLLLSNYIGLTTLISREAFESVGGFSPSLNKKKSYEDWDLWLTLIERGYVGVYNPDAYYYHRKLNQGSRNDADILLKLHLRGQLVTRHWRLYASLGFWLQLLRSGFEAMLRKSTYLKQSAI